MIDRFVLAAAGAVVVAAAAVGGIGLRPVDLAQLGLLTSTAVNVTMKASCASTSRAPEAFSSAAVDARITVAASHARRIKCGSAQTASAPRPTYVQRRVPLRYCGANDTAASGRTCVEGLPSADVRRYCLDGSVALAPMMRIQLDSAGAQVGAWEQVDDGCPNNPQAAISLSHEEFRSLPLVASVPSYQPGSGMGLVNMELIVFTDPVVQVLATTVLGTPVSVRATPVGFSWDFGDGSVPLVTSDPGAPYPALRGSW